MPLDQLIRAGTPVPIARWGEPVLHRRARPVTRFDADLWDLLATMFATNRAAGGAGLAAPQIGVDLAAFVFDTFDAHGRRHVGLVCNPEVEVPTVGRRLVTEDEGCLSLPGAYSPLARPFTALCRGVDQFGQAVEIRGSGHLARCLQHETDHLAGIVMEDRLSAKLRKRHRAQHADVADAYPASWPT